MVDASIVMVENGVRKLSDIEGKPDAKTRRRVLIEACQEVGPGLFFSLLIIVVSFLPVFALTGESYRLFSPLAFTKTYAMTFGAILAVTLIPVLMIWLLRGKMRPERANPHKSLFCLGFTSPFWQHRLAFKMDDRSCWPC